MAFSFNLFKRIVKKSLSIVSVGIKLPIISIYRHLPIEDKLVVFDNFNGRGYGCNPKYIAEELADSDLRLVWLAEDVNGEFPDYIEPVKYGSLAALRILATARVKVDNVRNFKGVRKRDGQFFIQTWHGMLTFKKLEGQLNPGLLDKLYIRDAKIDGDTTDLMIANNEWYKKLYEDYFWYKGHTILCGLPRLAPVINPSKEMIERVRFKLGLQNGQRVLLHAPTFRDWDPSFVPHLDYDAITDALESAFGGQWTCLLRLHPVTARTAVDGVSPGIKDVTNWPDSQELIAVADVLITDYSSMAFECAVAGKPVFLYAPDIDRYGEDSRGFNLTPSDTPFPVSRDMESIEAEIKNYDKITMENEYRDFFEKIQLCEDGLGAKRLAEIVLKHSR